MASGSSNTNSLRIVRSGVGFESLLTVEGVAGIQRMWPLTFADGMERLLVSTATSSAILQLDQEISLAQSASSLTGEATLAAGITNSGTALVQVTSSGIKVWDDTATGSTLDSFSATADDQIVAAAVKDNTVVAAFRKGNIIVFSISPTGLEQVTASLKGSDGQLLREIAAVDVGKLGLEIVIATSNWNGDINLFTSASLAAEEPFAHIREEAYATSLLFQASAGGLRILAGLSDGSLVSYDIEAASDCLAKSRVTSSLGSRLLTVSPLQTSSDLVEETVTAIGISERLTLLYESRNHVESSASGKKVS